jgi:hypothetical protein
MRTALVSIVDENLLAPAQGQHDVERQKREEAYA